MHHPSMIIRLAITLTAVAVLAAAGPLASQAASKRPVPCADISELRDLYASGDITKFMNSRTGDTLNYAVIGDGAKSDELIVMFPGTSAILPDWPTQMLTNSTYSPDIVDTDIYQEDQDGKTALCHDYHIVLFDYPGVGDTAAKGPVTADRVVNDVDAMLDDIATRYGISTDTVNLVGWSLGTLYALKYAAVAPVSNPDRSIGDLVLIASKPGGNLDGVADGNQAQCITAIFDTLTEEDLATKFKHKLEKKIAALTFPYVGQTPYKTESSECTAVVDTGAETISLSVKPDCRKGTDCDGSFVLETENRSTEPWKDTGGVSYDLYLQQRDFVNDWNYCHCYSAGSDYTSRDCRCGRSTSIDMSRTNGGVCRTGSKKANRPYSDLCAPLTIDGALTVVNGPEDLVIQFVYGRELVRAYKRKYGPDKVSYKKYRGQTGAGHGVMFQHPKWTQKKIYKALAATD